MKIKNHELKEKTVLEIGKFAILWNIFEKKWCYNDCNPRTIHNIAYHIQMEAKKQRQFADVLNARRMWFDQLEADYVRDSLHPEGAHGSTQQDMEIMRSFLEHPDENPNCGCLLVLNRIRNNLMHGNKNVGDLDGQIELFRAANAVLESI